MTWFTGSMVELVVASISASDEAAVIGLEDCWVVLRPSSYEASEKDSFSDMVAPNYKKKRKKLQRLKVLT